MLIFNMYFLLFSILSLTTVSVTNDLSLNLAEKYFNLGDYYSAITEYKRFIFFNSNINSENISYSYYKIGSSYRNQKKWSESIDAFQKSIQTSLTEDSRDERKIDLAVTLISCADYSAAEFLLIKVEMFSRNQEIKQKAAFFRGISLLYSFKWNQAREAFKFCSFNEKSEYQELFIKIDSLIAKAEKFKYRSPKLAKALSTILPGSGQIYAGNLSDGINALLINLAVGYLFFSDIFNRKYFDAIFNSLFIFERFYSGNRLNAEEEAIKHNYKKNTDFARHVLRAINNKINE